MNSKNVTFSFLSDHFNKSESKEYFINSNCFGDDLIAWFMNQLRKNGFKVEGSCPDQEDFGWYFNFEFSDISYTCLALLNESEERWICVLEFNAGILGSLFGKRKKPVPESVAQLFDEILRSEPLIFQEVEWKNRLKK